MAADRDEVVWVVSCEAGSKSKMHEENLRPNVGEGWDGRKSERLRDEREGGSG